MLVKAPVVYQIGMPESCRPRAAELYEEAFGQKFTPIFKSKETIIEVFIDTIKPELALVALENERLVGIAGFYYKGTSFTGGMSASYIVKKLGLFKGLWAITLLTLIYERKVKEGEMWMDGIVVDSEMRGRGVGTSMLEKLAEFASDEGFKTMKLEVIDTNSRARNLYESLGFKETKTEHFPFLKPFLGFSSSTTMEKTLDIE